MRRLVFPIIVAFGLVLVGAGSASAEPTPAAGTATAVPGKKVCKIADPKLDELSGLVATEDGFIAVNDSTDIASHKRIFYLSDTCQITRQVKFSGNGPRDTEDLALSPDGKTLWIGDIGDNTRDRSTIGLWKMTVGGTNEPVLYRLSYPDGDGPYDAEGLMINGDGSPIILTKEPNKISFFVPTRPLRAESTAGVKMKRAGEIKPPASSTDNPFGPLGRAVATGAAVSPDRSRMVIRTYADAFQWPVTNDDLLGAIKGTPTQTPLPNEPGGESITYSTDGKYLYTVSDMQGQTAADNYILRYTPAAQVVAAKTSAPGGSGRGSGKGTSFFSSLSLDDITYLVGGVGVLGAILVASGVIGIMRARKRPPGRDDDFDDDSPDGPKPGDAETELLAVGGPPAGTNGRQAGVYGGRPGAAQSGPPQRGGPPVYGRHGGGGPRPASGGAGGPRPAPGAGGPRPAPGAGGPRPAPGAGAPRPAPGAGAPRPVPGGGRSSQGGQPGGRPVPGGGRPAQGGQPMGRPGGQGGGPAGGQGRRADGGGQPGGRPGRSGGSGVYGAPPSPPPSGRGGQGGPSQRPSGFFGQGGGPPDGGRQARADGYADEARRGRDIDNPDYGRSPNGR
jgi:hypothetical protein